jgi:hypothetical protein
MGIAGACMRFDLSYYTARRRAGRHFQGEIGHLAAQAFTRVAGYCCFLPGSDDRLGSRLVDAQTGDLTYRQFQRLLLLDERTRRTSAWETPNWRAMRDGVTPA